MAIMLDHPWQSLHIGIRLTLLGVYICVTSSGNVSPYNPLHILIRAVDHAMHLAHICDCCGSGCGAQNCAFNIRPSKVDSQFAVRLLLMAHVSFLKFVMRSSEMMDHIHAQNNTRCEIHDVKIFPPPNMAIMRMFM